jgi:hypothetical protein
LAGLLTLPPSLPNFTACGFFLLMALHCSEALCYKSRMHTTRDGAKRLRPTVRERAVRIIDMRPQRIADVERELLALIADFVHALIECQRLPEPSTDPAAVTTPSPAETMRAHLETFGK